MGIWVRRVVYGVSVKTFGLDELVVRQVVEKEAEKENLKVNKIEIEHSSMDGFKAIIEATVLAPYNKEIVEKQLEEFAKRIENTLEGLAELKEQMEMLNLINQKAFTKELLEANGITIF